MDFKEWQEYIDAAYNLINMMLENYETTRDLQWHKADGTKSTIIYIKKVKKK